MAHGELIRPVQGISEGRRYAARVAAGSLLLVIGVVAAVKGSTRKPASLANGSSSLGNVHAAQSAANTAESNVATFLAAMKAQRSEPTRTDAHALDWNWAPELERSQKVKNWVGKAWVEPLGGQKIVKIAPPKVGVVRNRLTEAMDSVGRAKKVASKQMTLHMQDQQDMPRLSPLHYFANKAGGSTVSTDWNTQDVIKLAKRSVDFVQHGFKSGTESHESKSATSPTASTESHKAAPVSKATATSVNTKKATASQKASADAVPDSVLEKEKALQAQIASLKSDLAKDKQS